MRTLHFADRLPVASVPHDAEILVPPVGDVGRRVGLLLSGVAGVGYRRG